MSRTKLKVMPGVGAETLKTITRDVQTWNQVYAPGVALPSEVLARGLEGRALAIGSRVATDAIGKRTLGDIDALVRDLDEAEKETIVQEFMARSAVEAVERARGGTSFGQGRRVRMTVNEEGVTRKLKFFEPYHGLDKTLPGSQELEPGTVIEGNARRISSSPEHGGLMIVEHRLLTSFIHGLVDPDGGEPRVGLDVMAKH